MSKELKIGLTALIVGALSIWGFNYLKGFNILEKAPREFFVEYNNVQGLNTASPVTINGMQVGRVLDITFNQNPSKRGVLVVKFGITKEFDFSTSSVAKLYSASLMGGEAIKIVPSFEGELAKTGDTLVGTVESDLLSSMEAKLNPLQSKLADIMVQMDTLLVGVNDILDHDSRVSLRRSIKNLETITTNFKGASKNIDALVIQNKAKLDTTLTNAQKITDDFAVVSSDLKEADLSGTIEDLRSTINKFNSIATQIESGEGTVGKLMYDEALYVNLEEASKQLAELLEDFKLHPKRYVNVSVFGKKDKGYVAPEKEEVTAGEELEK